MSNVTVLRSSPRAAKTIARKAARLTRRQRIQHKSAYAVLGVAGALTALSLEHLATGATLVTHCTPLDGYALASGIDLGFIALEAATLVMPSPHVAKYARPAILATLALSAVMNAFAFAQGAEGMMVAAACALGAMIPGLVYAQVQVAAAMLKGK